MTGIRSWLFTHLWPPMPRRRRVLLVLLLSIALADFSIYVGIASRWGFAHTDRAGTCFGLYVSDVHYRFFYATHRIGAEPGFETIGYPWRSVIFDPRWDSESFGFTGENLILDWSEYGDHSPPADLPRVRIRALGIPHWPIACLTCVPALILLWQADRCRNRSSENLRNRRCFQCSYDIRGHKVGDKCPECGTLIAAVPPTQPRLLVRPPP